MSKVGDAVEAFRVRINDATNNVAGDLVSLEAKLAEAGTVEEVHAILNPSVEALEALAAAREADPVTP